MRFRRRHGAPEEPEAEPDPSAWSTPEDVSDALPPPEAGYDESVLPEEPEVPTPDGGTEVPLGREVHDGAGSSGVSSPPGVGAVPHVHAVPEVPRSSPAEAPSSRRWDPLSIGDGTVRAAGGVVWTRWGGSLKVVLIHRAGYDDWSLPKGKANPGETDAQCALREVREETGLTCSLGGELTSTSYRDRHGRPKVVRYFAMQPLGGSLRPEAEVDEVRWLGLDEAKRLVSYERDVEVLDSLAAVVTRDDLPPPR